MGGGGGRSLFLLQQQWRLTYAAVGLCNMAITDHFNVTPLFWLPKVGMTIPSAKYMPNLNSSSALKKKSVWRVFKKQLCSVNKVALLAQLDLAFKFFSFAG